MDTSNFDLFHDKEKAIHHALWLNFKYRIAKIKFGVIHGPDESHKWAVVEEITAQEMEMTFLDILPKNYENLTYDEIRRLYVDENLPRHWEELKGSLSTMDGEILRFILHAKIPLEKLIRFELASRGHDENHRFCGFEKAQEIWLK